MLLDRMSRRPLAHCSARLSSILLVPTSVPNLGRFLLLYVPSPVRAALAAADAATDAAHAAAAATDAAHATAAAAIGVAEIAAAANDVADATAAAIDALVAIIVVAATAAATDDEDDIIAAAHVKTAVVDPFVVAVIADNAAAVAVTSIAAVEPGSWSG